MPLFVVSYFTKAIKFMFVRVNLLYMRVVKKRYFLIDKRNEKKTIRKIKHLLFTTLDLLTTLN